MSMEGETIITEAVATVNAVQTKNELAKGIRCNLKAKATIVANLGL